MKKKTHEQFIEELEKINLNIEVLETYINSTTKILVKCTICGHEWNAMPSNLLNNGGCPKCNESKGEKSISSFLDKHNIKYKRGKRFHNCRNKLPLPFDFYLPAYNICIEYDGQQHYKPIQFKRMSLEKAEKQFLKTKECDEIKTNYCSDNNIKLIRIPYWEKKNVEKIILDLLY